MAREKTSKSKGTKGRKRVQFELQADPGSQVFVAGDFNDWNPQAKQLKEDGGVYSAALMLPKGQYQYKFVVNGTWCVDPECTDWIPNDQGSLNSVVIVN
jgi:1,4-alpha-glucan branching enzyme